MKGLGRLLSRLDRFAPRPVVGALLGFSVLGMAGSAHAQGQTVAPATPPPAAAPAPGTPAPANPPAESPPAEPVAPAASEPPPTAGAQTEAAPSGAEAPSDGGSLFESAQAEADEGESKGGLPFDWSGYVRGDFFAGKSAGEPAWESKAAYGELSLKLRTKKEKFGDAYAETRLRYGLQSEQTNVAVEVREAYVNAYLGPLDLRLGQQVIVWGRADAFNPTNNLTPFDLRVHSPVEDDRRVGNFAARAFLNFEPIRIEGVWVPLYRAAEIPTIAVPQYVAFDSSTEAALFPPHDLSKGTEAARIHLELPSFEMSLSYLYGYAPLPGLDLSGIALSTPEPIHVHRVAYDHHVIGFDFSTAIGDLAGVRGEAAFRSPLHYENRVYAPNPDVQYVLGVDHTFGSVSVIAQYLGRYTLDWKKAKALPYGDYGPEALADWPANSDPQSTAEAVAQGTAIATSEVEVRNQMLFQQLERVQHLGSIRIEWLTLHDTLSVSAFAFVNFSTQEWAVLPKVAYQLSDALSTTVGAQIYGGPQGTLLGVIDAQLSAGYAELRYAF